MADTHAAFIAEIEKVSPTIAQTLREAFTDAKNRASATRIEAALDRASRGDIDGAVSEIMETLRLEPNAFADLDRALEEAYRHGGDYQMELLQPPQNVPNFLLNFDIRHTDAERFNRANGARLVTEILGDTRVGIRDTVQTGIETGRAYSKIRRDLVGYRPRGANQRTGGMIGLHSRQATFVRNARQQLEDLDAGYFERTRRDRRFDSMVRKAIREDRPLTQAQIEQITIRYSERLLDTRGNTIARTETNKAMQVGRDHAFRQLIEREGVPEDAITLIWQATPGPHTRDSHAALNGQKVKWGETFVSPVTGVRLAYPHDPSAPASETINCRCSLRRVVDWTRLAR